MHIDTKFVSTMHQKDEQTVRSGLLRPNREQGRSESLRNRSDPVTTARSRVGSLGMLAWQPCCRAPCGV